MKDYIPYVYLVKNKTTDLKYLGVRYAKNCHPSDFWIKYFTSSKLVRKLIEQYGKDDFLFKILHVFPNEPAKAISKEAEYFSLLKKKDDYLNLCYSSGCLDLRINSKAGKVGGKIVYANKIGIFRSDEDRRRWASVAGKIGGKKQAERGQGFHKYKTDPELHKKWCSKGGIMSGQFQNKEFQSEMGTRGGVSNKGFIWINNGIINKKYTKKLQLKQSLDDFLLENPSWKKGRIIQKATCSICGKTSNKLEIGRYHNENCKYKKERISNNC